MFTCTPGIETDWIEEEMSDDDDFRKDVIEQKIKKVLEEIGFTKKIVYKVYEFREGSRNCRKKSKFSNLLIKCQNLSRWTDGPPHNGVAPVVAIFRDKKDKTEVSQPQGVDMLTRIMLT